MPAFMDDFYLEKESRCSKNKVPWQWFGHALAGHAAIGALQSTSKGGPNKAAVMGAAAVWGTAPLMMAHQAREGRFQKKKAIANGVLCAGVAAMLMHTANKMN